MQFARFFTACFIILFLSPGTAQASDIKVGMSAAFSGPSEGLGVELYRGAMAYFEHVNHTGGVNGRKIILQAYDDGYNPIPAINNTVKLIEEDNVLLLFNYVGTPTVTRVLPLLKKFSDRRIYLFFPFTGAQPQRELPYSELVFNLRASYREETGGLVDHLVGIGRKRIAVFYQADAYGRSGWDGVRRALAKHGLKIAGEATYRRGAKYDGDFREQVSILRRANPDAVISVGSYAACAAFIRALRDAGSDMPAANLSFVGSESLIKLLSDEGRKSGRDYTRNLINSQVVPSYEDKSLPAVREYRELMDRYKPMPPGRIMKGAYQSLPYSFVGFEGFLNAKTLVALLKRMPRDYARANIKSVVETVRGLDIGINAPVTFGHGRNQGLDRVYYTTVRDGRFVPLTDWEAWRK
jgi:ABC-type branched-subunit amino acid transport system substrate-binding protein